MPRHEEIDRYLTNAKEILRTKAIREGNEYRDIKYVQMASGTAYNASLMIVDEYLSRKEGVKLPNPKVLTNTAFVCGNTTKQCFPT